MILARNSPFALATLITALFTIGSTAEAGQISGFDWFSGVASVAEEPVVPPVDPNNDDAVGPSPNPLVITQKAYTGIGPVDLLFTVEPSGGTTEYAFEEGVFNGTGLDWSAYRLELGFGVGADFTRSPSDDGLDFDAPEFNSGTQMSTFFPSVDEMEDEIYADGGIFPDFGFSTPPFTFSVDVPDGIESFTIRQVPIAAVPEPTTMALVMLAVVSALTCRKRTIALPAMAVLLPCCLLTSAASAASVASDTAADPVYSDGWQSGDNGGFGLGAWSLGGNGTFSHFMASSVQNGDGIDDGNTRGAPGDRDIDSAGRSWGMFSASGPVNSNMATAIRPLTGTLDVGQSLIVDMDNGFLDQQGTVGVFFGTVNDPGVFFTGGGNNYTFQSILNGAAILEPTPLGFADEGLQVRITRTASSNYSLTATLRNGDTYTSNGDLLSPISQLAFISSTAGGGSSHDAFLNSITVTPEPASVLLIAIGGLALVGRYRQ